MTIEEVKLDRIQLEAEITQKLFEFQNKTGLPVEAIVIIRVPGYGRIPELRGVELKVLC